MSGYHDPLLPSSTLLHFQVHIKMMYEGHKYSCHPAPMPEREVGLLKKAPSMAISRHLPSDGLAVGRVGGELGN